MAMNRGAFVALDCLARACEGSLGTSRVCMACTCRGGAPRRGTKMYKDAILDELRQIEFDVIEGERRLAEHEALLIELKSMKDDTTKVEAELELMRKNQFEREQHRQRLLALLHP
ncbi:hypothetical protein [Bradyrhizobium pachyrhizi]|nr:hypothetical protein [Bradyrhizobium pachyrhizi]